MKKSLFTGLCVLLICTTSCVTKKKYQELDEDRLSAILRGNDLEYQLNDCRDLLKTCNELSSKLSGQVDDLKKDTTRLGNLNRDYAYNLNSNLTEQLQLRNTLQEKTEELTKREAIIKEMQDLIDEQNTMVRNLLGSVKEALTGFNSDELSVVEKGGKIYVAMSDKLLFESGSARVDKRGEEALSKLGEVLSKQTNIDVNIEGHTDDRPIKTAQFKDNWDLSVIRATSVVRILTESYNVSPLQVYPSGRGEYMPIGDNETADGRSKNRRTEIIISPKLDKLFELLN